MYFDFVQAEVAGSASDTALVVILEFGAYLLVVLIDLAIEPVASCFAKANTMSARLRFKQSFHSYRTALYSLMLSRTRLLSAAALSDARA